MFQGGFCVKPVNMSHFRLLLRFVDDFLLVTPHLVQAEAFLR